MAPDADVTGLLEAGVSLAMEGRLSEAEDVLRDVLIQLRGSGSENESKACGNLGSVYSLAGRRFEALFLYRHGLDIARSLGDLALQVRHLANICLKYLEFRQWSRLPGQLNEIDLIVGQMPREEREAASNLALDPRLALALRQRDLAQAHALAERFRAVYGPSEDPSTRLVVLTTESELCRVEGDLAGSLDHLQQARGIPNLQPADQLFADCHTADRLHDIGREDEARELARETVPRLELHVARNGVGDLSIELAADLAAYLATHDGDARLSIRAYDIAATAALARIASLERCARELPELVDLSFANRDLLTDLRHRYRLKQKTMLVHVSRRVVAGHIPAGSLLRPDAGEQAIVLLCASCQRAGTEEGNWLPVAHYLPTKGGVVASHGLCPTCAAPYLAEESESS